MLEPFDVAPRITALIGHFNEKPARIRFRVLDPEHALLPLLHGNLVQDITLDAESFARLDSKVSRTFITENEINFLAFPQVKAAWSFLVPDTVSMC
jgi:hypothetical protein